MDTSVWKKSKPQYVQNIPFVDHGPKKDTRIKGIGTTTYWNLSVRRLSIFADLTPALNPGFVIDGLIDPVTRSTVKKVLNKFMEGYVDKPDKPPFTNKQLDEMYRIIGGGLLLGVDDE